MPLATVRAVLIADSTVAALVSDRISPVETAQATSWPCVVLSVITDEPQNHLQGFANLDLYTVALDAWAYTYAAALQLANACRTALQSAGYLCAGRNNDQFDFEKDPGAYRVGYTFQVWK